MELSYKTKRLILISVGIIILALAASEGTKDLSTPSKPLQFGITYPNVPRDIDPRALEQSAPFVKAEAKTAPAFTPSPRPLVSAEAYLVANLETGKIYVDHNSRQVFPIASLSKLVTALVALHSMQTEQKVTVTQSMLDAYGEAGHLVLGESFTVSELFYPLLLESSNDAAEAIAQSYGYDSFIQKMNEFARELGMTVTFFKDASGLNPGNVSNARDLFTLARYVYGNEKPLLELTRQVAYSVGSTTDHGLHIWHTINPFPFDPHFIGGKTGRTDEAKESMISLFKYTTGGKTYPIAILVLRSDFSAREVDSSVLLERFIRTVDSSI